MKKKKGSLFIGLLLALSLVIVSQSNAWWAKSLLVVPSDNVSGATVKAQHISSGVVYTVPEYYPGAGAYYIENIPDGYYHIYVCKFIPSGASDRGVLQNVYVDGDEVYGVEMSLGQCLGPDEN
jgi:hypothetical protein